MNFVFGSSGQIGSEFSLQLGTEETVLIDRHLLTKFCANGLKRSLLEFFAPHMESYNQVILAIGQVNPKAPFDQLISLNIDIPFTIISALNFENFKFISLGTIHEKSSISNPYIDSKREFFELVSDAKLSCQVNHFRLHTLYSNLPPKSTMFLGQIYLALKEDRRMTMSSGLQFREYHHVSEDVSAILSFRSDSCFQSPELTGGNPIRLRDLAIGIFEYFEKGQLLEIQDGLQIPGEIYEKEFRKEPWLEDFHFSDPLSGVLSALARHL